MVYAILLIFFGMAEAEQKIIAKAACDVSPPTPVAYEFDSREGVTEFFGDGSSLTINNYSTIVRSADGIELYFSSSE